MELLMNWGVVKRQFVDGCNNFLLVCNQSQFLWLQTNIFNVQVKR